MQPNPAYEDPNNTEMSTSAQARTPAMKAAKRASYVNSLAASAPPPPPPRRVRGASNNSSDTTAKQEEFIPNPSNASDILADLSRLQKEVDDLRGHYEGRKVSH